MTFIVALAILSACGSPTATPNLVPESSTPSTILPTFGPVAIAPTSASEMPLRTTPTAMPTALGVAPETSQPSVNWPMFRFSLDRAGYNPNETRLKPPLALEWEYKTGSKI